MKGRLITTVVLGYFVTVNGYSQFAQEWDKAFPSPSSQQAEAADVAMDTGGNVYTLGALNSSAALLIKYNSNGDTLWSRTYASSGYPLALRLDPEGNPVMAAPAAVVKYDTNGNQLWMKTLPPYTIYTMSLDDSGNVLLGTAASVLGVKAVKYTASGDSLWHKTSSGLYPTTSTTDNLGDFYVTGVAGGGSVNIFTVKYTPGGDTAWVRVFDRSGFSDQSNTIVVDDSENVIIAGYASTGNSLSNEDYAVIKYDQAGNLRWQRFFDGPGNGQDQVNSIDADAEGSIYMTGAMTTTNGTIARTMKLSAAGDSLWGVDALTPSESPSVIDDSKGLFIAAVRDNVPHLFAVGVNQNGVAIVSFFGFLIDAFLEYSAPPNGEVVPAATMAFRATPSSAQPNSSYELAIAAHRVVLSPFQETLHTLRYSAVITDVGQPASAPNDFTLLQNYPNPFNPTTEIRYQTSELSHVSLKVFDVLGREVATLVDGAMPAGTHNIMFDASHLASGMYLYRLQMGSRVTVKKMALLK
jgi:Secretion system C-terminal sorting domain